MIQAVINATGVQPIASAGKPESAMYDEARELAAQGDTEPVCKARSLAIGDRLDTDIEAGNRGGYDSLAVLTGVTNPTELMCAPKHRAPPTLCVICAVSMRHTHESTWMKPALGQPARKRRPV